MENKILLLTVTYPFTNIPGVLGKLIIPDISESTILKAINKIHGYTDSDMTHLRDVYFIKEPDIEEGDYFNMVDWKKYYYEIEVLQLL